MICKHCNAEVEDNHIFCPFCGKDLAENSEATKPQKKTWQVVLSIVGAVVGMAVLACVLLLAMGVDILPKANDIYKKDNYTVSDEKAVKKADDVIATIGEKTLTNSEMMFYYHYQIVAYVQSNGSTDLDVSKPLNEQMCTVQDHEDQTWQQFFVETAIQTWKNYQLLVIMAEEAGFTLSEESEKIIADNLADAEEEAVSGGFESADAMIAEAIGVGCDLDGFTAYLRLRLLSQEYYNSISKELEPTDEEVDAFYTENVELFEQYGITKETGLYSSVRHILICPEGGVVDEETQTTTYSEAEWAAAQKKAEALLEQWKNGEATEESFGELAATETHDTYSAADGGLYTKIYKGSGMVEEFQNWAIDPARAYGDTEIVKTQFGYHIMYFVEGEMNWLRVGRVQALADKTEKLIAEKAETLELECKYGKIAMPEWSVS